MLGYRDDVNKILPIFDVFFFPSITEGQPNSLIEAMISDVPFGAFLLTRQVQTPCGGND